MTKFSVIKLNAGNDINGNPRQVYIVLDQSQIIATYDIGYEGREAITNKHHKKAAGNARVFTTTPGEYKSFIGLTF